MENLYSDITPETVMRKERVIRIIDEGIRLWFKSSDEFMEKSAELSCHVMYQYNANRKLVEGQRLLKEVFNEF